MVFKMDHAGLKIAGGRSRRGCHGKCLRVGLIGGRLSRSERRDRRTLPEERASPSCRKRHQGEENAHRFHKFALSKRIECHFRKRHNVTLVTWLLTLRVFSPT